MQSIRVWPDAGLQACAPTPPPAEADQLQEGGQGESHCALRPDHTLLVMARKRFCCCDTGDWTQGAMPLSYSPSLFLF